MNTKHLLLITAVYPPEPVVSSKLSHDLYLGLKDDGYVVCVLHPQPTRPNGFSFDDKVTGGEDEITTQSYVCPQSSLVGRMRESWSFGKACSKYIKEHHSEISCIYANAWPMFSQKAIVKAARKYSIPCIIHVQDVYPESLTNKMPAAISKIAHALILPMDIF